MRLTTALALLLVLVLVACTPEDAVPLTDTPVAHTATVAATSTATPTATLTATRTPTPTRTPRPSPTATPGPEAQFLRLVVIDQDAQTMVVYEDGEEIRRMPVSTGLPDRPETMTPAWEGEVGRFVGTFFAFDVYADEAWYLFDHYGSMLIHGAPYVLENGEKVYQELDVLGVRPASHGCIRLPPEEALWFSAWEPQGAHVIIYPLSAQP
jgi:lipoprotein-anchoring transpeptidase ErfK/SrfK